MELLCACGAPWPSSVIFCSRCGILRTTSPASSHLSTKSKVRIGTLVAANSLLAFSASIVGAQNISNDWALRTLRIAWLTATSSVSRLLVVFDGVLVAFALLATTLSLLAIIFIRWRQLLFTFVIAIGGAAFVMLAVCVTKEFRVSQQVKAVSRLACDYCAPPRVLWFSWPLAVVAALLLSIMVVALIESRVKR